MVSTTPGTNHHITKTKYSPRGLGIAVKTAASMVSRCI